MEKLTPEQWKEIGKKAGWFSSEPAKPVKPVNIDEELENRARLIQNLGNYLYQHVKTKNMEKLPNQIKLLRNQLNILEVFLQRI